MSGELEQVRDQAKQCCPADRVLVDGGQVVLGDLIWNFVTEEWVAVEPPKPFVPGQKRAGFRQITAIGDEVSKYAAVARKR